jgi:hypothetical protein
MLSQNLNLRLVWISRIYELYLELVTNLYLNSAEQ